MKIGLFTQNIKNGGMDTFIINFINNSKDHHIYLFYNKSKSISRIKKLNQNKNLKIIIYDYYISNEISFKKYLFLNSFFKKILKIYFFTIGIVINIFRLKKLFNNINLDKLVVLNGGYPGGEVCISAVFSWFLLNRNNKAWYNIHNYPVNIHSFSIFRKFYENIMDYLISKSINGIITVSKSCKKEFNKRPMIDESLIHYIHNGFDKNTFYYKSPLPKKISNYNKDSKIIFFPSVIEKRKGHKNIIKAMDIIVKNNKNIHLIICGEGDLKEESELNYLINNSLSKNNIHFFKFTSEISSYYNISDLVVIPSISMESFGYTAIEAMSYRIPVVASNLGGLKEIVINNETGYLIEKNNFTDFAKKINFILNNTNILKKFGKNGYKHYLNNFTAAKMVKKYFELILNN